MRLVLLALSLAACHPDGPCGHVQQHAAFDVPSDEYEAALGHDEELSCRACADLCRAQTGEDDVLACAGAGPSEDGTAEIIVCDWAEDAVCD
jgi:hypothetical protein